MTAYQGMTPHPDGVVHERLPMANVTKVTHNIALPLPGIVKCAKATSYHMPEMSHLAKAPAPVRMAVPVHAAGGSAPKTKSPAGMIGLERR